MRRAFSGVGSARISTFPQELLRLFEIVLARNSERVAVRRRDPDRRCSADRHRANRVGNLGRRTADELDVVVRQPALVEQDNAILLEADDPLRLQRRRHK